jgi:Ca2+-binding RTX toxin-like protein
MALILSDTNAGTDPVIEYSGTGTVVDITVSATGGTGPYKYFIENDPTDGGFTIDQSTGVVSVLDGSHIDFEAFGSVALKIRAEDSAGDIGYLTPSVTITDLPSLILGSSGSDVIDAVYITPTDNNPNTIYGKDGDDEIHGLGGDDQIEGGAGDDEIFGGDDEDIIWGDAGNDIINGGDDDDELYGSQGDDLLIGGDGNDIMDGGGGEDTAKYSTSAAGVTVDLDAGTGTDGDADGDTYKSVENVIGSEHADEITGNDTDNVIEGGAGADVLIGGPFNMADDNQIGDTLSYKNSGQGVYIVLGKDDTTFGTAKNGDAQGDQFKGFENILGSAQADTLTGNTFDNIIEGGGSADILDGGSGTDALSYAGSAAGVTITLGTSGKLATGSGGDAAGDKFSNFEDIHGSSNKDSLSGNELANFLFGDDGDDRLNGGAGDDQLAGGDGIDTINGGDGDDIIEGGAGADVITGDKGSDTVFYRESNTGVVVLLGENGALTTGIGGHAEGDKISQVENVVGSEFNDTLSGNKQDNVIQGGAGADNLSGGEGNDTASYLFSEGAVTVNLALPGTQTSGFDADGDSLISFENLIGSSHDDILTGDTKDNVIEGQGGADKIDGGAGDADIISYANSFVDNVTITLNAAGGLAFADGLDAVGDTASNIEGVYGTAFDDILTGNLNANIIKGLDGDDTIKGGNGVDTLDGGDDFDTIDLSDSTTAVTVTLGSGTSTTKVSGATTGDDVISNFERIIGTAFNDVLTGNSIDNTFVGGLGTDTLNGGSGSDTADYTGAGTFISVTLGANGAKSEVVVNGGQNDSISLIENIIGTAGNDTVVGNALSNTLRGEGGADTLTGGAGVDTILGGAGDDTIIIGGTDAQADVIDGGANNDTITVNGTKALTLEGFDSVSSSIEQWVGNGFAILGTSKNNFFDFSGLTNGISSFLQLDLGSGDDTAKALDGVAMKFNGSTGDDTLIGASLGDTLDGGDGDDAIEGLGGDDTITGGKGNDSLVGGLGKDSINAGAGDDFIDGGDGDDIITISGSDAQFDVMLGGGDNDTIQVTGNSALTLQGFKGTAQGIEVWNSGNVAIQGNNDDNEFNFTGVTVNGPALVIDGGAGNDVITGPAASADLRGGLGDDTLVGGAGGDTLNGGAGLDNISGNGGNDIIVISGTEAQFDVIDGGADTNTIQIKGTSSVTLNAFNSGAGNNIQEWLGNGRGVNGDTFANVLDFSDLDLASDIGIIDGNAGNDNITGSDVEDDIRGGIGQDLLFGGDGNDTLNGGVGQDELDGGIGNDKLVVNGAEGQFDKFEGGNGDDTLYLTGTTVTLDGFDATDSEIEILDAKNTAIVGNAGENEFDFSGFVTVTGYKSIDGMAGDDTIIGVNLDTVIDDLRGGSGNDTLEGRLGNDRLTGGAGNDTFVFDLDAVNYANFGNDTIVDFRSGVDVLRFDSSDFSFTLESEVVDLAEQVGANTVITIDDQNTITLLNFTKENLRDVDIVFF